MSIRELIIQAKGPYSHDIKANLIIDASKELLCLEEQLDELRQQLMAGAFEEGRLRGALEKIGGSGAVGWAFESWAREALRAPTLEEGER